MIIPTIVMSAIFLTARADTVHINACTTEVPYDLFLNLWNIAISELAFIGSLFSDDISIYPCKWVIGFAVVKGYSNRR